MLICFYVIVCLAEVAQLVEQRTENPCVGGSSPPLGTKKKTLLIREFLCYYKI